MASGIYTITGYQDDTTYRQVNIGGMWRTDRVISHSNLYFPTSQSFRQPWRDKTILKPTADNHHINDIYYFLGNAYALYGVQSELGYVIPKAHGLTTYVGAYNFFARKSKGFAGLQTRVEYPLVKPQSNPFGDSLTVEAGASYDGLNHTSWFVGVRFATSLGRNHHLDTLQQAMVSPIESLSAGRFLENEPEYLHRLNHQDGSPITLEKATDRVQIEDAIQDHADIIDINDTINNVDTIHLNPGQSIVGGWYTMPDGSRISFGDHGTLNGAPGEDLIDVSSNNHIEDLTLHPDGGHAITNVGGKGFGHLLIDGVSSTGNIVLGVKDGSTNNQLDIEDNHLSFNSKSTVSKGIDLTVYSGKVTGSIVRNHIMFNNALDHEEAISLATVNAIQVPSKGSNIDLSDISNNIIHFANGNYHTGIELTSVNAVDNDQTSDALTIEHMDANKIDFAGGNDNYGLYTIGGGLDAATKIAINSLQNNQFTFGKGDDNAGVKLLSGTFGSQHVSINQVGNNEFGFGQGAGNEGFYFDASKNSTIAINTVSGQDLSKTNHGASVYVADDEGQVEINHQPVK